MRESGFDVVTGAFGYIGKYITRRLLASGRRVVTLTGHPRRANPFGPAVVARPFDFGRPAALVESLAGADTLYNTYWVRFSHAGTSFDQAVENSRTLMAAAREAGVRRVVHISITNPSRTSPLPYFRGKALVEEFVGDAGTSHAILRPTVVFGDEDVLINNIAWLLRRFPVFVGAGYRRVPLYSRCSWMIWRSSPSTTGGNDENEVVDAVGPDVFTFDGARAI